MANVGAPGTPIALAVGMLRIRIEKSPLETLLRLDGRLAGPWVAELARCWAQLRDEDRAAAIGVDLEGVTFVSAAGKALLARLHGDGALLTARACTTSAIIEEIVNGRGESE